MSELPWLLMFAVFAASFVQAATGIGFGLIAGPVILIVMNNGEAIQVSIILTFLVAAVLARGAVRVTDKALMRKLMIGICLGAPVGILIFNAIDIVTLKLAAGLTVLTMAISASGLLRWKSRKPLSGTSYEIFIGAMSGLMGTALAMPGPAIAALMATEKQNKDVTRGTMLTVAIFSSPITYGVQLFSVGTSETTLSLIFMLTPVALLGTLSGRLSSRFISEKHYQGIIVWILIATAGGLLLSI